MSISVRFIKLYTKDFKVYSQGILKQISFTSVVD